MSLELALREHLKSKSEIVNIVGTSPARIWTGEVAPDKETLPDVLFALADEEFHHTLDGGGEDCQFMRYLFTARAVNPTEMVTLGNLVRRALYELRDGATITTPSGNVEIETLCILGFGDDQSEMKSGGSTEILYERSVLVEIAFRNVLSAVV